MTEELTPQEKLGRALEQRPVITPTPEELLEIEALEEDDETK